MAKSSVSVWVRDVEFDPASRRSATTDRRPRGADHPLRRRKLAEIEQCRRDGAERIGRLSEREFLVAGLGLYAGDGSKRDGEVKFSNSDPCLIEVFCRWLRSFFVVDASRLRVSLYLHQGLDLAAAQQFWVAVTGIPLTQFRRPYRAVVDETIRHNKHEHGCASVAYACARTHREIMGMLEALPLAPTVRRGSGSGADDG